jgi:quercetin dioxygenase-like cupin family protein
MRDTTFRRLASFIAVVAALSVAMPSSTAFAQQLPPGVLVEKRFEWASPPAQAEVAQLLVEFAPGSWTPPHTHGGPAFVTVLEGEMKFRHGGMEQTFKVGETWIEDPVVVGEAGNTGTTTAVVLATFVVPKGAAITTGAPVGTQQLPPGPTTVAQARWEVASGLPAQFDVVQRVTEIAPGGSIPMHTHPGQNHVMLLQGQMTLNMDGMAPQTFRAGDNWVEPANVVHGATNSGSEPVRFLASVLVPRGAAASTPAAQPAAVAPAPAPPVAAPAQAPRQLPRTGEPPAQAVAALLGLALAAGGVLARRRS